MKLRRTLPLVSVFLVVAGAVVAQRYRGEGWGGDSNSRTAREVGNHSTETPVWTNARGFEKDVFTFARIRYSMGMGGGYYRRRGGGWGTDLPDSDLNLS